jgi:hypothetical protein
LLTWTTAPSDSTRMSLPFIARTRRSLAGGGGAMPNGAPATMWYWTRARSRTGSGLALPVPPVGVPTRSASIAEEGGVGRREDGEGPGAVQLVDHAAAAEQFEELREPADRGHRVRHVALRLRAGGGGTDAVCARPVRAGRTPAPSATAPAAATMRRLCQRIMVAVLLVRPRTRPGALPRAPGAPVPLSARRPTCAA